MNKQINREIPSTRTASVPNGNIQITGQKSSGIRFEGQEWFTPAQVSAMFGRYRGWAYDKIKEGVLSCRRIQGTRMMIPRDAIDRAFKPLPPEQTFNDLVRASYQVGRKGMK